MMIDVLLFYEKKADQIDTERFWKTIDRLGFKTAVCNLLYSLIQYGNIEVSTLSKLNEKSCPHTALILDDLEKGGWLGNNDKKARSDGWYEYNRQVITKRDGELKYYLYMIYWKLGRYVYVLFPTLKQLAKRYPYIVQRPVLVPWAWLNYILYRLKRATQRGSFTSEIVNRGSNISDSGAERVDIFRKLDMM